MNGIGIGCGMVGVATIGAVLYMAEHGYTWWQMALMFAIGLCLSPSFRRTKEE